MDSEEEEGVRRVAGSPWWVFWCKLVEKLRKGRKMRGGTGCRNGDSSLNYLPGCYLNSRILGGI